MASKKKLEWPPPGWKVEMKVSSNGRPYKCYINSETGEKVYTKRAVLQCVKKGKKISRESQSHGTKEHPKTKSENKEINHVEATDSLNLPPGWTLEWKVRQSGAAKGTKYKCITDPSTGSKFYSMPEVYRYLKNQKASAGSSKKAKGESTTNSENNCSVNPMSPQKSNVKKESPEESEPTIPDKLSAGKTKSSVDPMSPAKTNSKKGSSQDSKPTVETKLSSEKMKSSVDPPSPAKTNSKKGSLEDSNPNIETKLSSEKMKSSVDPISPEKSNSNKGSSEDSNPTVGINSSEKIKSSVDPTSPEKSNLNKGSSEDSKPTSQTELSSGKMKSSINPLSPEKSNSKKGSLEESIPTVQTKFSPGKNMKVEVERSSDEDLPSGWIKEIRIKKNKNIIRRDPFFIETATGLVFRSKLDVLRYLETGEISRHAYRRKKDNISEKESPEEKTPGEKESPEEKTPGEKESPGEKTLATPSSNIEKSSKGSKRKHLVDEVSPMQSNLVPVVAVDSNQTQSKRVTRSSLKVHTVSTGIEQIHSLPEPVKTMQEMIPEKPIEEVSAVRGQSKRVTRSSSKFQSADVCGPSLEQMLPVLSEPALGDQEMVAVKPDGEAQTKRRTRSTSKVQSSYISLPDLEKMPLSPEPAQGVQEMVAVKPDGEGSSVGVQSKKRTRSTSKVQSASTCGPSLEQIPLSAEPTQEAQEIVPEKPDGEVSSVGAQNKRTSLEQVLLLPERAQEAQEIMAAKPDAEVSSVGAQNEERTRSSSHFQSASTCGPSPQQAQSLTEPAKKAKPAVPGGEVSSVGTQKKRRGRPPKVQSASTYGPSLEQAPSLTEPAKKAEEMVSARPDGQVSSIGAQKKRRGRPPSKVQSAPTCGPSLEQIPSLTEPVEKAEVIMSAKTDVEVSSVRAQSKRRRKSSAMLQPAFTYEPKLEPIPSLPEPTNGTQLNGAVQPAFTYEPNLDQISSLHEPTNGTQPNGSVHPALMYEPKLDQVPSLPEPMNRTQPMFPAGPNGAVSVVEAIGDVGPEAHVANGEQNNSVPKETESSTFSNHKSDVKPRGSRGRKPGVNRNTKRGSKMTKLPSHSSRRVAEVEPEVLPHSMPIEHADLPVENDTKSDVIRLDSIPNESQQRVQAFDDDDDKQNVITSQPQTSWAFDINIPTVLTNDSFEKIDYIPQEYIEEIFLRDEGPPGFTHYSRSKITQSTIDQLFEDPVDTIPEDTVKSPEEHIIQEEQQDTTPFRTQIEGPSGNCPIREGHIVQEEQQYAPSRTTIEKSSRNCPVQEGHIVREEEQDIPSWTKIGKSSPNCPVREGHIVREEQQDTPSRTTSEKSLGNCPIQEEQQDTPSWTKIGKSALNYPIREGYIVREEQRETPPRTKMKSSGNCPIQEGHIVREVQQDTPSWTKIGKSFGNYPIQEGHMILEEQQDTPSRPKIMKSSGNCPIREGHMILEEQQETPSRPKIGKSIGNWPIREETTTLERNNNEQQPGSQFSFSSTLWSDPCLEFAFKTLTGALPLDDNVAIQDYMEHQLRTCDQINNNQQSPHIGMSSFCQNDETKLAPPLSGDVGFSKLNGFNSHKPSR